MEAEVRAMELVKKSKLVKVVDIYFYDCSKTICDSDYFFMEKLEGDNLYDFVHKMLSNLIEDAVKENIPLGINEGALLDEFARDKSCFDEVTQPTLWGEAYMDDRFRRHTRNGDFLRGYGQTEFSTSEMKRIIWYDIILYLTMMIEVTYRKYDDDGQYHWAKRMLHDSKNMPKMQIITERKSIEKYGGDSMFHYNFS